MNLNGLSLWRQIGEALTSEIDGGSLTPGQRLPADTDLAVRFGVNRHTVRRALTYLKSQGLLRSERGRGTFVVDDALEYRLGARTRFTQNLLLSQRTPGRKLLSVTVLPAATEICKHLEIERGSEVALVCVIGEADQQPICLGRNFFSCRRLPGIADAFRAQAGQSTSRLSITETLRSIGVRDYHRQLTRISCRPPSDDEARHLRMPSAEYVLETESLDVDEQDQPLIYAKTSFRGSSVRFVLES